MLNRLWFWLFVAAVLAGILQISLQGFNTVNVMSEALLTGAQTGVDMSIGLIAALVFWLGIFKIAEDAGIVHAMARALMPVFRRLFPDIPEGHPALSYISMNVSMSMLGIDNGALPSGLKAMSELSTLNPTPTPASRAQQMFLVYMTASVTIFPISILGYRMKAGAAHPADVFLPLLLASYAGLLVGLGYMAVRQRLDFLNARFLIGLVCFVSALVGSAFVVAQWSMNSSNATSANNDVMAVIGNLALLIAIAGIVMIGWWRKVPVYDSFLSGAKRGFGMAISLIPYLVGMLAVISLLRASGFFGLIQNALVWLLSVLGADSGANTQWILGIPQGLMKPFSGSGARAMMLDIFKTYGPDSFIGHLSSIIQGASDTSFYILTMLAGSAKLKQLGHAVDGVIIVWLSAFAVAVLCALVFFT